MGSSPPSCISSSHPAGSGSGGGTGTSVRSLRSGDANLDGGGPGKGSGAQTTPSTGLRDTSSHLQREHPARHPTNRSPNPHSRLGRWVRLRRVCRHSADVLCGAALLAALAHRVALVPLAAGVEPCWAPATVRTDPAVLVGDGGRQRHVRGGQGEVARHPCTPLSENGAHLALPGVSGEALDGRLHAEGMVALVASLTDQHHGILAGLPAGGRGRDEGCVPLPYTPHCHPAVVHVPPPATETQAHLQVWHTLHSGHCQPERLRGVRAMSRQAPW